MIWKLSPFYRPSYFMSMLQIISVITLKGNHVDLGSIKSSLVRRNQLEPSCKSFFSPLSAFLEKEEVPVYRTSHLGSQEAHFVSRILCILLQEHTHTRLSKLACYVLLLILLQTNCSFERLA